MLVQLSDNRNRKIDKSEQLIGESVFNKAELTNQTARMKKKTFFYFSGVFVTWKR